MYRHEVALGQILQVAQQVAAQQHPIEVLKSREMIGVVFLTC
jgi:hypothetical protein